MRWMSNLALLSACAAPAPGPSPRSDGGSQGEISPHQDILTTHLDLDLDALEGRATLHIRPDRDVGEVALDVSGLTLQAVRLAGETVDVPPGDGWLRLPTPSEAPVEVEVEYGFRARGPYAFDGWMPDLGVSFVWPYHCGMLFPCNPSMDDGVVFTMEVAGGEGERVYPESTHAEAPSYMPAIAVGDYTRLDLGATSSGTELFAMHLGDEAAARRGTRHLVASVDFFERTYGPYAFGPEMGAVEVDWGDDSWGGMEHHPYYHVGRFDFGTGEVHAHEAAHGWFGNGVRVACWEDFVLSEGTVTYMAARAFEEVGGPDLWDYYVQWFLTPICEGDDVNTIVMPDTCGAIDLQNDDLWSLATYMKGACFYEEVGDIVGDDALDAIIGEFYAEHVHGAAQMEEMIRHIEARTDPAHHPAIREAVEVWLLTRECPADFATRCG